MLFLSRSLNRFWGQTRKYSARTLFLSRYAFGKVVGWVKAYHTRIHTFKLKKILTHSIYRDIIILISYSTILHIIIARFHLVYVSAVCVIFVMISTSKRFQNTFSIIIFFRYFFCFQFKLDKVQFICRCWLSIREVSLNSIAIVEVFLIEVERHKFHLRDSDSFHWMPYEFHFHFFVCFCFSLCYFASGNVVRLAFRPIVHT